MVTAVLGLLLGGAVANGMTWVLGAEVMQEWAWRVPFLIAAPLGFISMYIRLKLEDSPEFLALQRAGQTSRRRCGRSGSGSVRLPWCSLSSPCTARSFTWC